MIHAGHTIDPNIPTANLQVKVLNCNEIAQVMHDSENSDVRVKLELH